MLNKNPPFNKNPPLFKEFFSDFKKFLIKTPPIEVENFDQNLSFFKQFIYRDHIGFIFLIIFSLKFSRGLRPRTPILINMYTIVLISS